MYRLPIDSLFLLFWLYMVVAGCDISSFFSTANVVVVSAFAIADVILTIITNSKFGSLT